jgi:hypothetical protein
MWVEFHEDRHSVLLTKGARIRVRRLYKFGRLRAQADAEIRGVRRFGPLRYRVRYWGLGHMWISPRFVTHIWVPDGREIPRPGDPSGEPSGARPPERNEI